MEELSIEEKARRYDEAIAKGRQIQNTPYTAHWDTMKEVVEHLFPELAESEDERIRKEIIYHIQNCDDTIDEETEKRMIAWLEKKGEKNPITFNNAHIIDSALNDYCCKQYSALHKENGGVLSFARLQHLAMDIYGWCEKQVSQNLANSANTCKVEQNLAWSEEDEHRLKDTIYFLDTAKKHYASTEELHACIDWLKSLKERYTWKPSESDILLLERIANGKSNPQDFQASLCGLIGQLKKLKG